MSHGDFCLLLFFNPPSVVLNWLGQLIFNCLGDTSPWNNATYIFRSDGARDKLFKKDGLQVPDSSHELHSVWPSLGCLKNQAFTGDNGLHGVFPKGQLGQGLVSVRAVSRKSNKLMGLRPLDISLRDSNLYYYLILFQIQIISNYDELVHTDLINALNGSYSYVNCRSCTRARSCRPHFAQALSSCRVKVEWLQGGKMPTVCLSKLLWIALFERHFHLKMHTSTQD